MHCHCVCVEYVQCAYTPKVGKENKGEGRTGERLVRACTCHVNVFFGCVACVCISVVCTYYMLELCVCGGARVQFHGAVLVWLM